MDTSSFHVLDVIRNAAMNMAGLLFLFPLDIFPEVALLDHMVALILIFLETFILSAMVAMQIYNFWLGVDLFGFIMGYISCFFVWLVNFD